MGRWLRLVVAPCVAGAVLVLGRGAVGEPAPKTPTKEVAPDEPAPEGALELRADEMDLDLEGKTAELHGHVRLDKSDMTLRCEHMSVRYDEVPIVKWAKGTGGVVLDVRGIRAKAPEVVLDLERSMVTLSGGVRVSRKEGWLSAEQATVSLATGHVKLKQVKGVVSMPSKKAPPKRKTPKRP